MYRILVSVLKRSIKFFFYQRQLFMDELLLLGTLPSIILHVIPVWETKYSVYFFFCVVLSKISFFYELCIIADLLQKLLILLVAVTRYFCCFLVLTFLFPFPLVLAVSAHFVAGSHGLFSDGYECVSTFFWVLCGVLLLSMATEQERYTVDWILFSLCYKFWVTSLKTHIHPVFSEQILCLSTFSFPKERQYVPIPTGCDGHFDM